jgi:hypothetical protein
MACMKKVPQAFQEGGYRIVVRRPIAKKKKNLAYVCGACYYLDYVLHGRDVVCSKCEETVTDVNYIDFDYSTLCNRYRFCVCEFCLDEMVPHPLLDLPKCDGYHSGDCDNDDTEILEESDVEPVEPVVSVEPNDDEKCEMLTESVIARAIIMGASLFNEDCKRFGGESLNVPVLLNVLYCSIEDAESEWGNVHMCNESVARDKMRCGYCALVMYSIFDKAFQPRPSPYDGSQKDDHDLLCVKKDMRAAILAYCYEVKTGVEELVVQ